MSYPIIYFYSLREKKVIWNIFDGWIFLEYSKFLGVQYKDDDSEHPFAKKLKIEDKKSKKKKIRDYVWYMTKEHVCAMKFGEKANETELEFYENFPPSQKKKIKYKLDYDFSSASFDEKDTCKHTKLVEAVLHQGTYYKPRPVVQPGTEVRSKKKIFVSRDQKKPKSEV